MYDHNDRYIYFSYFSVLKVYFLTQTEIPNQILCFFSSKAKVVLNAVMSIVLIQLDSFSTRRAYNVFQMVMFETHFLFFIGHNTTSVLLVTLLIRFSLL